ncbi:hypothetical protein D9613_001342 [Agrocybe pediades]|uniref:non-specific serine/threonine protein kinase n=1 Tax=Agrocybe pediades TaxID=84607 RepID=A0A8H4VWZ7_9AGAR|nr:hypothetical protein D9613_001342 [Agrocybe pediades]
MGGPQFPKVAGFQLVAEVGGGGFATVYRAVNIETEQVAACKVMKLTEETTDKERKLVEREMRIHSSLKHNNVLEFLNAVVVEVKHRALYFPGIYMLLEYASGGDLFDKIVDTKGLDEDVARIYFRQLVSGMKYLHSQGVCHRDLKPENILLDAAGTLKVCDFGLASVYRLKGTGRTRLLTEKCGSLPYVAPELNSDKPYEAEPIDVWGVGIILYALLAGYTPWDEPTAKSEEFSSYVNGEAFGCEPWTNFSARAFSMLTGILTIDPEIRLRFDDIVQHPWYLESSELEERANPVEIAERLTQRIRENGELTVAAPALTDEDDPMGEEKEDEDVVMTSSTHKSQFTQSLMLFSQTQSGARYTPHLTRFYAAIGPSLLIGFIKEFLESANCQSRSIPPEKNEHGDGEVYRLRIGGYDTRKQKFKGWVDVENFKYKGTEGSFCVMRRDEGNPICWRQLWKRVIQSESVEPHVLKK